MQLAALAILFSSPVGFAADQGHGRVTMNGSIIDSACALDTESRYQTIDMLTQPASEIISEGFGHSRPFTLHLINCQLQQADNPTESWQHFAITFDGIKSSTGFGINGDAEGIALQIRDANGNIAEPGMSMPVSDLTAGEMSLNYTMRLVGNGENLKSGSYHSAIRYKLDYY
ncbi:type 1 fimbrial protein [Serratia proteamaculans]|nr:type 1 fimbrial protein [Serratia proteamaculans]